jgi:hypothetical protein
MDDVRPLSAQRPIGEDQMNYDPWLRCGFWASVAWTVLLVTCGALTVIAILGQVIR